MLYNFLGHASQQFSFDLVNRLILFLNNKKPVRDVHERVLILLNQASEKSGGCCGVFGIHFDSQISVLPKQQEQFFLRVSIPVQPYVSTSFTGQLLKNKIFLHPLEAFIFVMAHEWDHLEDFANGTTENEDKADRFGLEVLKEFNKCSQT